MFLRGQRCVLLLVGDRFTGLAFSLSGEDVPFYTKIERSFLFLLMLQSSQKMCAHSQEGVAGGRAMSQDREEASARPQGRTGALAGESAHTSPQVFVT